MKPKLVMRFVAFVVFGALLAWVLVRLNWHELGQRLVGASPVELAVMFIAWISASLLRPLRFRYLLNVLGHVQGVNYWTIWTAMVLGAVVNSFAPMRAGDVVLIVFLRQRLGISMQQSFTVIVADGMCDFALVVTVFLGALAFAPAVAAWTEQAIIILSIVLFVGAGGIWSMLRFRNQVLAMVTLCLARMAPRRRIRGAQITEEFLAGLAAIGTWKTAAPLILISALIWGLIWLSYWFGLRAVFPTAPAAGAAFNMAAVALSFVVPLGPGGLGAFEAASVLALAVFDIPLEAAIAFAVIAHVFQLGSVLSFAAIAVLTRQIDYRSFWAGPEKQ